MLLSELFRQSPEVIDSLLGFAENPLDLAHIYKLSDFIRKQGGHLDVVEQLIQESWFQDLFQAASQYTRPPDLSNLAKLPQGSLGRVYADLMISHGYTADFYTSIGQIQSTNDFLDERLRLTHDIWHVVAGFPLSYPGEMGLMALMMSQLNLPIASLLLASALIRLSIYPEQISEVMAAVCKGWTFGKKAKSLTAQKWEKMWDMSLTEIRASLGIPPEGMMEASLNLKSADRINQGLSGNQFGEYPVPRAAL